MKFTINRTGFRNALSIVKPAAQKGSMRILQNVKVSAQDNRLTLTATDLDITIRTNADCEVAEPGETTIPAALLYEAVSKMQDGNVVVSCEKGSETSEIAAGSARFRLQSLPADDFPKFPSEETTELFTVPCAMLRGMIRRTAFATALDETRKMLMALNLTVDRTLLTAAATDGRRLSVCAKSLENGIDGKTTVLLPKRTVAALVPALSADANVTCLDVGSQVAFKVGGSVEIWSKKIDGEYPNYVQVIPNVEVPEYTAVSIERELFGACIDRASIVATEGANAVNVRFADNEVSVTCKGDGIMGAVRDAMPVRYDGEPKETNIDAGFLADAVRASDASDLQFFIRDAGTPCVVKDEDGWLYVVMPLRV